MPFFSSFDATPIHYRLEGSGAPVLLAHGFATDAATTWPPSGLDRALAASGFQAVMIDLRGHGRSGKPHALAAYRNDAEVRDIIALRDHLGLESYAALGYSHGAIIVARLLVLDRQVTRAVLAGLGHHFTNPAWQRPKEIARGFTVAEPADPIARGLVKYARKNGGDPIALANIQLCQPCTTPRELAAIRRPVLLLNGERDRVNGSPERLAGYLADARLAYVPGDHLSALHAPGFAGEVVDFLRA